jgi:hypothetical protein
VIHQAEVPEGHFHGRRLIHSLFPLWTTPKLRVVLSPHKDQVDGVGLVNHLCRVSLFPSRACNAHAPWFSWEAGHPLLMEKVLTLRAG